MADQLKKVVTTNVLENLNLKSKSGLPLKNATLDVGHTIGKGPEESTKRAFELLSQHLDTQGKVPMRISVGNNGYPTLDVKGLDPAKTKLLKDRLENDPKWFDEQVDKLAQNKDQPFTVLADVDPEFQRPLVPEDLEFLTTKTFSDPKSNFASPKIDAWLQRTQENGWWGEQGKNLLGSFFGRGYNEKFQNMMRSKDWEMPVIGGNRFSGWVADKTASLSDNLISFPTALGAGAATAVVKSQYGVKAGEDAANDVMKQNAVLSKQETSLREGLDSAHIKDADWSDPESTQTYIRNSKYANRYLSEDAFSDVLKSNYGGKLKRLYEADAVQVLQNFRKAYAERHKGLKNGQIPKYDDKGRVIKDKNGDPQFEPVDLKAFESGIKTEGGVFLPIQDRPSEDLENRGIPAEDGNRYVAMLYVPNAKSRTEILNAKKESKKKQEEGKPMDKVKSRAEIAAELDSGKSDEEPIAQWVFVDTKKKGTAAIYRDAQGNPAKPKFK